MPHCDRLAAKIWRTYTDCPSESPRYIKKQKLKRNFRGRLAKEIEKTELKLELLKELVEEE